MIVYVTQDNEGEVVGVTSEIGFIQTGLSKGLKRSSFLLNGMNQVGPNDRPWVVYFKDADETRPQVWPITEGFPDESGPGIFPEGIEFCTYAENAAEALSNVFGKFHFDSWDVAVSDWNTQYGQ